MKLVDILARELKEWPEGAVIAVQDSDGEVKFDDSPEFPVLAKSRLVWIRQGNTGDTIRIPEISSDNTTSIVTRSQWQAAVDALKAEVRPTESMALHHQEVGRITRQWNGEGLPPVGTVCEYLGVHQFDEWSEVKIFADWGHGDTKVVFFDFGDGWREERSPDRFRAVRTQDQIEEMRLSVKEMCAVALTTPVATCDQAEIIMRRLYDAGYRKFEIVDN